MLSGLLSIHRVRAALLSGLVVLSGTAFGQTLVLNEVSNGPSGNAEYFEMAVVPVDPCTDEPCLDLRGWIFDDNNGAHSSNGPAPGCGRFNNDPLWSCVPLGTLIVVYNSGDANPSIPPEDLSTTDGNCSIIVGSGNNAYLEYTNATPSITDCVYPAGPWSTGGWSTCLMANPGDCARVQDPDGCETSVVCYGNANGGPVIHIAGNGQRRVFFSSGDPAVQGTWSYGCAAPAQCGTDDQTPGLPNNAGNAAYLAPFSVCAGVVLPAPLEVTATNTNSCGCTGTADATATGSVAGYTFAWYDDAWVALGQNTAQATGLCA
ncbi:MAG TPA: hypothetical protein VHL57_09905, partial [Flavobacteriales bacterium]|nr:hypothetical protein [Flavobacteriales bacterium]